MEVNIPTLPSLLPLPPQIKTRSPAQYFTLPTTMAAVGTRGSGKTYNLMLWNKWMFDNKYFTRFFVISPTYESNDPLKTVGTRPGDIYTSVRDSIKSLEEVIQSTEEDVRWYEEILLDYTDAYEKYLAVDKNISKLDRKVLNYLRGMQIQIRDFYENYISLNDAMEPKSESILYTLKHKATPPIQTLESILETRYDELHPWFYPPPKLRRPVPLLFIDDCSHSPIYSPGRDNPLVNLTLRHRHIGGQGYGISIQFAVQTFKTGVPKALRQNTMQFLIFKTNDVNVILDIYQEVGAFCTDVEFIELYYKAIQEKHDFFLIDLNAKDEDRLFRRNWDTFLVRANAEETTEKESNTFVLDPIQKKRALKKEEEKKEKKKKKKTDVTTDDDRQIALQLIK
jgi:hypothetical protein